MSDILITAASYLARRCFVNTDHMPAKEDLDK